METAALPHPQPATMVTPTHYTEVGLHHAAIIMDGNRRWARERDLPTIAGHQAGVATLKNLIEHIGERLNCLTVYAFSTENWRRAEAELEGLMGLFGEALVNEFRPLHNQNVRVRFLGNATAFPNTLQAAMTEMSELTRQNTGLTLQIAMNYGGRAEIIDAIHTLQSTGTPITEASLASHLSANQPPPDVVIRTGGEQRLSNFLLWQAAYAELLFTPTLWPEFTPTSFDEQIMVFAQRQRRFGR